MDPLERYLDALDAQEEELTEAEFDAQFSASSIPPVETPEDAVLDTQVV